VRRPRRGLLPQRIHMVGIGGIGLSAIARVLAQWGYQVSGSDLHASMLTAELNDLGIVTHVGHAAEQIAGAELLVISSAIPESNPEVRAARQAGVPVFKRQQLLSAMMSDTINIAIAGTHGKTTTAAMITLLLQQLGQSPTFVVGGILANLGVNAQAGQGPHFVIEADEYDRTFHGLSPFVAVVTNIEMDHPDCYRDLADLGVAFGVFLDHVAGEGAIVACSDSPELRALLASRRGGPEVWTYGVAPDAAYRVEDIRANAVGGVDFGITHAGQLWGAYSLSVPGAHNALNATAALLVAERLGLDRVAAAAALLAYRGTLRRFEIKGERQGVLVVDDYAHHPTQVRATLAAARTRFPGRRLWALFQPHTFSRTRALLGELANCFADADELLVTDIYAARAHERPTISMDELLAAIRHPRLRYVSSLDEAVATLLAGLAPGDVLLTLGAGDDYLVGERVLAALAD
jgi:UDP-N-acetylmuramate--alanine ligase